MKLVRGMLEVEFTKSDEEKCINCANRRKDDLEINMIAE